MALSERDALDRYYALHDQFARKEISGAAFEAQAYWVASNAEDSVLMEVIKAAIRTRTRIRRNR